MNGDGPVSDDGKTQAFRLRLSELKRSGCGFLVTGAVSDSVLDQSCRRAFGDDSHAPRHRLLVATDRSRDAVSRCLPVPTDEGSTTTVIDHTALSRSVTADAQSFQQPGPTEIRIDRPQLGGVGQEIVETVAEFESYDHLPAGAVRVCIGSLAPLLDEYDDEQVFRFLHLVLSVVRRANGMLHVYLPKSTTHETVRLLEPIFDAVIELRTERGFVEQRWSLRDGPETGWFQL